MTMDVHASQKSSEKSTYRTTYRDNLSAKQKQIRQRLQLTSTAISNLDDAIPSIDDDSEQIQKPSTSSFFVHRDEERVISKEMTTPTSKKRTTAKSYVTSPSTEYGHRSPSSSSRGKYSPVQYDLDNYLSIDQRPRRQSQKKTLDEKTRSIEAQNQREYSTERHDEENRSQKNEEHQTFSKKPHYNSLLRAHDSIRLKTGQARIRPKSAIMSRDNDDDDTDLADSNKNEKSKRHSSHLTDVDTNERAIDVKGKTIDRSNSQVESENTNTIRNSSTVKEIKIKRSDKDVSLGVTVCPEDGNICVARILAGGLVDRLGVLKVGDIILSVDDQEVYTPEQLQEILRKSSGNVNMKIVPSLREELPTMCIYLRAMFNYDANEDSLLPCPEVGVSFNHGDILEVVNQEDPNWWQARRVDSENLQTGLIPSQELEERRHAFITPDFDYATKTTICGTKVTRKKKKEIYNLGQNSDFDKAELQLYEEVCRTPAFDRRTLVLIGANGVGRQGLKARLIAFDPDRFGTPLPHTTRPMREGEEDGVHYHFVSREEMSEDIVAGKYLEYGNYDGHLYGTKLDSIRQVIGSGKMCILDCSATCLKILKTPDYLPFIVFIAAPPLDQLRYMQEWNRNSNKNYTTLDRALSRQSRRARTLQSFAFDFFEDEDLQVTIEESARLFRTYENFFDLVLVNNNFEKTFEMLKDAVHALSMEAQWIPINWIYGT